MGREILSVALPGDLRDRLDELARKLGLTRSGAVRYILSRALGEAPLTAALEEELSNFHGAFTERGNRIRTGVRDLILREFGIDVPDQPTAREVHDDSHALPARGNQTTVDVEAEPAGTLGLGRVGVRTNTLGLRGLGGGRQPAARVRKA